MNSDEEDLIFPRAPVRVGPKFQSGLPELNCSPLGNSTVLCMIDNIVKCPPDDERGGDNTIEVYSAINILTDAEGGFLFPLLMLSFEVMISLVAECMFGLFISDVH
jgi:hypothetical protein